MRGLMAQDLILTNIVDSSHGPVLHSTMRKVLLSGVEFMDRVKLSTLSRNLLLLLNRKKRKRMPFIHNLPLLKVNKHPSCLGHLEQLGKTMRAEWDA